MSRIVWAPVVMGLAVPVLADGVYWSSARGSSGGTTNRIHLFDENGVLLNSVEAVAGAQTSAWGYRDGMTDRSGHIYFGWEDGLARHNLDASGGVQLFSGPAPGGVGTWRALAFDPTGDSGNGSLWTQSFGSPVAEIDMNGNLLQSFPN
ncbi:MAG: hypothetical protein GY953_51515, partial [bacterium]|nr:hypothetical protein [bacterium]